MSRKAALTLFAFFFLPVCTPVLAQQQPWTASGSNIYNANTGNVGIGTSSPATPLDVNGQISSNVAAGGSLALFGSNSSSQPCIYFGRTSTVWTQCLSSDTNATFTVGNQYGAGSVLSMTAAGNVGIGTTSPSTKLDVVGDITASGTILAGNIVAKYQDLAEWVFAKKPIPVGSVVIVDPDRANSVAPSSESYDTRVAGVVSGNPGIMLGESGQDKVKVATTGRVRVHVEATTAPIHIGDLLVTSSKEGMAMRSEAIAVAGRKMHQPGTLIGKALEPLDRGEGEILVLLSLQ